MRKDKDYIFTLRKEGKSYKQIERETGVSRGTLGAWFKDLEWSDHIHISNKKISTEVSKKRILEMNEARKDTLYVLYRNLENEAKQEYETYKHDPLFWAGLMTYAGEGDKRSRGLIRVSNSEFYLHTIFIQFILRYLKIEKSQIRCGLLLFPDHNESLCKEMWSNLLDIPRIHFHKTQIIRGKEQVRRLQYGVGMTIISSTGLKKKLLKWLSLAQDEKFMRV